MPLALEEFALAEVPAGSPRPSSLAGRADPVAAPDPTEADYTQAFEQGYKAGWDDATRAEAEDQARIGAEFARNLQDLSFTFHEARAHVIQSMEPILAGLTGTLLPALVAETLGARILDELRPLIEASADAPIELLVAPQNRAALERQVESAGIPVVRVAEEPSLAEGQAYLRVGAAEREIDLTGALDRIRSATQALYDHNERNLRHG